jgi:hypothetical protein
LFRYNEYKKFLDIALTEWESCHMNDLLTVTVVCCYVNCLRTHLITHMNPSHFQITREHVKYYRFIPTCTIGDNKYLQFQFNLYTFWNTTYIIICFLVSDDFFVKWTVLWLWEDHS